MKFLMLSLALLTGLSTVAAERFFRVATEDNRWYFKDPAGEKFYAVGVDHVSFFIHPCVKRGGMPYHEFCRKAFGSEAKWAADTAARLRRWGFNTVGVADKPGLMHKQGFAFPVFTAIGSSFAHRAALRATANWRYFPNVFDPAFERACLERARNVCAPYRDNPLVLGYFIDNELQWSGSNPPFCDLWDDTMRLDAANPAKQALIGQLKRAHRNSIAEFNQVWGVNVADFEAIARLTALPVTGDPRCEAAKLAFFREIADRYFKGTTAALRAADPNHLILGNRFAGKAPDWVIEAAGRYCDVVSINSYPVFDFERGDLSAVATEYERIHRLAGKPLYLTEWSVVALDTAQPCTVGGGMRVDTQQQRAKAAGQLQSLLFRLPFVIGSSYFMWADQSPFGRSKDFSENCSYGLVNERNEPYEALTAMFAELNGRALALHAAGVDPNRLKRPPQKTPPVGAPLLRLRKNGFEFKNRDISLLSTGTGGNLVDSIAFRGAECGRITPMLQFVQNGTSIWRSTQHPGPVRRTRNGYLATRTLVDAATAAPLAELTTELRVTPSFPGVFLRPHAIRNLSAAPLSVLGFYLQPHGVSGSRLDARSVPSYYRKEFANVWYAPERALRLGAFPLSPEMHVRFWSNPDGSLHPDCRVEFTPPRIIAPGQTLLMPAQAFLVVWAADQPMTERLKTLFATEAWQ